MNFMLKLEDGRIYIYYGHFMILGSVNKVLFIELYSTFFLYFFPQILNAPKQIISNKTCIISDDPVFSFRY